MRFEDLPRQLGEYGTGSEGPLLVAVGGIHGNEPSGVHAIRRVLAYLTEHQPQFRGRFVGLLGNRAALSRGCRFVDHDLNRGWRRASVQELLCRPRDELTTEDLEQRELFEAILAVQEDQEGRSLVLDLHSFSSQGPPFAVMNDTLANRRIADALPMPVILGLEEALQGTLLDFVMEDSDTMSLGVEGGQHDDPRSIHCHEATLWIALETMGCMARRDIPNLAGHRRTLEEAVAGQPQYVEVTYHHSISASDEFKMDPGFLNFQSVKRDQRLARDKDGPVLAPEDGHILMPLYQEQGEDGFFLSRPVRTLWLKLSAWLRRMHADRWLVPWLPGVRVHSDREYTVLVTKRVARWFTLEVFHLLGYRRRRDVSGTLVFTRRDR